MLLKKIPAHLLIAASSWMSRIVSAIIQIACIKIIINILGSNGYAAFVLLSALIAWGALADLGVGSALQNYISERRAAGKTYQAFIFYATLLLCSFIIIILSFVFFLSPIFSEIYLKNFNATLIGDKNILFFSAIAIFCVITIGNVLFKIWFAELKGWIANIFSCCCSIIGFVGVYCSQFVDAKMDVLLILLIFYGPLALFPVICFFYKNIKIFGQVKKHKKYISIISKMILSRANGFLLFTFMGTLVLQADYLVMSQKIPADDIVVYSILMRIFGFVFFVYSALLQAVWPVCVEYRIKKEWRKLQDIVVQNVTAGISLVIVSSILIYYLHSRIFDILAPQLNHHLSWVLFVFFCLYFSLRVWSDTFAMLLQSMNYLKPLWLLVPVQACLSIALQWCFAGNYGLYGIMGGLIASFVFTVVLIVPVICFKKIRALMSC
ncbi:MATE family efflux transporter [Kosakonia sacchari]|uniref:MATE family efflux transporter n=1 Tax=Kosakonia sacchari TaxID=1158459 RepID=UPI002ACD9013|nr:MATE family efflux transporter [Kosakonia sacchari]MDZ7324868.1 MATE family efflux transporter [Kosakonia sacchari]